MSNSVITAVRSVEQENRISSALNQLGWTILYRAMNTESLLAVLNQHPEALVIAAEDFHLPRQEITNPVLIIDKGIEITEFSLQELLHNRKDTNSRQAMRVSLCTAHLIAISTLEPRIGGTTLAINVADELIRRNRSTLLIDLNYLNPSVSRYFDIPHINRKISTSRFGFDLAEISQPSALDQFAQLANSYQSVVVDLGTLPTAPWLQYGVRIYEIASRWALQSANEHLVLAREDDDSLRRYGENSRELRESHISIHSALLLVQPQNISRRDVKLLQIRLTEKTGESALLIPREIRGLHRAAQARSPLHAISPHSPFIDAVASLSERIYPSR